MVNINEESVLQAITAKLSHYFGTAPEDASEEQIYKAVVLTVKDILTQKRTEFRREVKKQQGKRLYYLCMEFLLGRSLKNHLLNLGLSDCYENVLQRLGFSPERIYELEPDPGLGNGGLGRLAACYMDALTTLDYDATGFCLLYEYGLFQQRIVDGEQVELPDRWLQNGGDVWLVPREDKACSVFFGGHVTEAWKDGHCDVTLTDADEVQAIPYDMMISGTDCQAVGVVRLWKACDSKGFNMKLFSQGQYVKAMEEDTNAEIISKVLYPSDNHTEGRLLRLTQQYFLVSASLQSIVSEHLRTYGSLDNFTEKVAIHINDTHPATVIPELMRIFIDKYSYSWEDAWRIVTSTVSYTNHTVMPEALECWNEDLFKWKLPRIYAIIEEINRRFCADLWKAYPGDWQRISRMAVIGYGQIRMANLSVIGSHTVGGVSKLHLEILKKTVFHDYTAHFPGRFTSITNGIAHRRWLCMANPRLTELIDSLIGSEWHKEPKQLQKLTAYQSDVNVLSEIGRIRGQNKCSFAEKMQKRGILMNPDSLFDVQVKRMHEYKRQLLNVLKIIAIMQRIRENPNGSYQPQTFLFGAKAATGYSMAKRMIKLISCLGEEIRQTPKVRDCLNVVFLEEYNVSLAEDLIPAADVSEQISLSGKEASGTGCMKLMANGALTLGTMDGANIEIAEAVGEDHIYTFGLTSAEVDELWKRGYHAEVYYRQNETVKSAVDRLGKSIGGEVFDDVRDYLIHPSYSDRHGIADPYMCLADFDSYVGTYERLLSDYRNKDEWNRRSLWNTAQSGYFSADRAVREYAEQIWHIKPIVDEK